MRFQKYNSCSFNAIKVLIHLWCKVREKKLLPFLSDRFIFHAFSFRDNSERNRKSNDKNKSKAHQIAEQWTPTGARVSFQLIKSFKWDSFFFLSIKSHQKSYLFLFILNLWRRNSVLCQSLSNGDNFDWKFCANYFKFRNCYPTGYYYCYHSEILIHFHLICSF